MINCRKYIYIYVAVCMYVVWFKEKTLIEWIKAWNLYWNNMYSYQTMNDQKYSHIYIYKRKISFIFWSFLGRNSNGNLGQQSLFLLIKLF